MLSLNRLTIALVRPVETTFRPGEGALRHDVAHHWRSFRVADTSRTAVARVVMAVA
jgi:hypothetical protein